MIAEHQGRGQRTPGSRAVLPIAAFLSLPLPLPLTPHSLPVTLTTVRKPHTVETPHRTTSPSSTPPPRQNSYARSRSNPSVSRRGYLHRAHRARQPATQCRRHTNVMTFASQDSRRPAAGRSLHRRALLMKRPWPHVRRASARPMALSSSKDFICPIDSELTRRYKQAGLIVVGKRTSPSSGWYRPPSRSPGRSPQPLGHRLHDGCGPAAVRLLPSPPGSTPMAHANDGGGSIRIPRHAGVFGVKPTRARVPLWPHLR